MNKKNLTILMSIGILFCFPITLFGMGRGCCFRGAEASRPLYEDSVLGVAEDYFRRWRLVVEQLSEAKRPIERFNGIASMLLYGMERCCEVLSSFPAVGKVNLLMYTLKKDMYELCYKRVLEIRKNIHECFEITEIKDLNPTEQMSKKLQLRFDELKKSIPLLLECRDKIFSDFGFVFLHEWDKMLKDYELLKKSFEKFKTQEKTNK